MFDNSGEITVKCKNIQMLYVCFGYFLEIILENDQQGFENSSRKRKFS